jgi:pilus assembly protein CpaE
MTSDLLTVGIIAPSAETREFLRIQVNATGLASVDMESDQYCSVYGDRTTRKFIDAQPDIVIIDMHDPQAGLQSTSILHAALPDAWLFLSSESTDSQLIIESMRAGAREFLPKPIPPRTLSQAMSRFITEKQRHEEARAGGKLFCITSAKGGSGATSLAINLAASLAGVHKARVALVDLNSPVGDAVAHLNLKPQYTVADALESASRLDSVLLDSYTIHTHGVAVLAGPKEYKQGDRPNIDALSKMLEVLVRSYTHSFVDLPFSMDKDLMQMVCEMAANIVVVSVPEVPALWRTERLIRFLTASGNLDKVRLVINRSIKHDEITDNEIERVLKLGVHWKLPNNYKGLIKAINSGQPLVSQNHSELARSYRELAHELAGIPLPTRRRGPFGLFS